MRRFWLATAMVVSLAAPGLAAGEDTITIGMILPGDKVTVQMTPYDLTKGRITFRAK